MLNFVWELMHSQNIHYFFHTVIFYYCIYTSYTIRQVTFLPHLNNKRQNCNTTFKVKTSSW